MSPGFHNIFIETLINARDHINRDPNCDYYEILINLDE
jgi:hypothetical protein